MYLMKHRQSTWHVTLSVCLSVCLSVRLLVLLRCRVHQFVDKHWPCSDHDVTSDRDVTVTITSPVQSTSAAAVVLSRSSFSTNHYARRPLVARLHLLQVRLSSMKLSVLIAWPARYSNWTLLDQPSAMRRHRCANCFALTMMEQSAHVEQK